MRKSKAFVRNGLMLLAAILTFLIVAYLIAQNVG